MCFIMILFTLSRAFSQDYIPNDWLAYKSQIPLRAPVQRIEIESLDINHTLPQLVELLVTNPKEFESQRQLIQAYVKKTKPQVQEMTTLNTKQLCEAINTEKINGMTQYRSETRLFYEVLASYSPTPTFAKVLEIYLKRSVALFNCSQTNFLKIIHFQIYKPQLELYRHLKHKMPNLNPGPRLTEKEFKQEIKKALIIDFWINYVQAEELEKEMKKGLKTPVVGLTFAEKETAAKSFNLSQYARWMVGQINFEIEQLNTFKAGQKNIISQDFPKDIPTFDQLSLLIAELKKRDKDPAKLEAFAAKNDNLVGRLLLNNSAMANVKEGKVRSRILESWSKDLEDFKWQ